MVCNWIDKSLLMSGAIEIYYKGFHSTIDMLNNLDWEIIMSSNPITGSSRLRIYHPETRLLGLAKSSDPAKPLWKEKFINLDLLSYQKLNKVNSYVKGVRFKPVALEINDLDKDATIAILLEEIVRLQKPDYDKAIKKRVNRKDVIVEMEKILKKKVA